MEYVALKPCSLGGQKFLIGDDVPEGVIQPGALINLIKMGIIADKGAAGSTEKAPSKLTITAHTDEGDIQLEISQEALQSVVDVAAGKADAAESAIKKMTDTDALILLDIIDSRKSIKAAAKERALALNDKGE